MCIICAYRTAFSGDTSLYVWFVEGHVVRILEILSFIKL
jgi:hypothetical protein